MHLKRLLPLMLLVSAVTVPRMARADVVIVHDDDWGTREYWGAPFAHPGSFGIGVGATSLVTGLTLKLYLTRFAAIQATGGWWYSEGPVVNGDLVFDMPRIVRGRGVSLNWDIGAGGTVGFSEYHHTGAATLGGVDGVLGLVLQIRPVPLEFTIELRPTYIVGNGNAWGGFYFGAGGAIRFFFW